MIAKFPFRCIHKYTSIWPNCTSHSKMDHGAIDNKKQSRILDNSSLTLAYTDHCLVAATLQTRLSFKRGIKPNLVAELK
jgi:hypothetical protein